MAARALKAIIPGLSVPRTSANPTRLWIREMVQSALSSPMTLKNSSGTKIPKLVYGTAWKKDRTADFVFQALKAGFRGIDTAAQPKHYQENLVGDGIRKAINEGIVTREELYVCVLFTLFQKTTFTSAHALRSKPNSRRSLGRTPRRCHIAHLNRSKKESIPPSPHLSVISKHPQIQKTPISTA